MGVRSGAMRFFRGLFGGFRDPLRRPRFIIWTGVGVLLIAGFAVLVLGLVSTRWFCVSACHKVQDDTIIAYSHSPHAKVSCMACHLPVNANPISFLWHKIITIPELYLTITNQYELPMNAESELAMLNDSEEMESARCTQCHSPETRPVTASHGIVINHEAHTKRNIGCTWCHNRVGHVEDFELTLPANKKHEDFMKMEACYRCHGLEKDAIAPGKCETCHTPDFPLKPESHMKPGFFPAGHGKLGEEDAKQLEEGKAELKKLEADKKSEGAKEEGEAEAVPVKNLKEISSCGTCHDKQAFCVPCHGMDLPHPEDFVKPKQKDDPKGHPAIAKTAAGKKCEQCHHESGTKFCDGCHHGAEVGWKYDPAIPLLKQHVSIVKTKNAQGCFKCHQEEFCSHCHVNYARK